MEIKKKIRKLVLSESDGKKKISWNRIHSMINTILFIVGIYTFMTLAAETEIRLSSVECISESNSDHIFKILSKINE